MISKLQFLPESASSFSGEVNFFFFLMVVVCGGVATLIAIFLIYSLVRYRRRSDREMPPQIRNYIPAEAAWIGIPLLLFMGMFAWGAKLYFDLERPPANAIEMYAIGKQWMWKVQHPTGQREINELHIPVGRPVMLTMTSQDVIHSFFIPAFRTKQDVLPSRFTTTWFQATKPGKYHLFCAEYCGAKHSGMIGYIYAMTPTDYQQWLETGAAEGSLASQGEKLFHQYGCSNCHHFTDQGRAPNLRNVYGRPVQLEGAPSVVADATYLRESILDPRAKVVWGYRPIMPTYQGQLSTEDVISLIAYIKAMGPQTRTDQPSSSGSSPRDYGAGKGIGGSGATSGAGTQPEAR